MEISRKLIGAALGYLVVSGGGADALREVSSLGNCFEDGNVLDGQACFLQNRNGDFFCVDPCPANARLFVSSKRLQQLVDLPPDFNPEQFFCRDFQVISEKDGDHELTCLKLTEKLTKAHLDKALSGNLDKKSKFSKVPAFMCDEGVKPEGYGCRFLGTLEKINGLALDLRCTIGGMISGICAYVDYSPAVVFTSTAGKLSDACNAIFSHIEAIS
jgi:hypothetical protein